MKTFRIGFHYIPKEWKARLAYCWRHKVSGLIALRTWSRLTHVEVWTPNHWLIPSVPLFDSPAGDPIGGCWTSTLRGPENGACVRSASEVLRNPERWSYKEYTCTDEAYAAMLIAMKLAIKNKTPYDKDAIFKKALGIKVAYDLEKLICNEFVRMALKAVGKFNWVAWFAGEDQPIPYWYDEIYKTNEALDPKRLATALPGRMKPVKGG